MANKWPKNGQKMANKNNDQLGLSRAKAAVPLRTVRGSLTETYMALAPRSPSRRSLRVASQYAHDPYPLAPLLADELPPPPTIRSVLLFTYLSFLSRRHLHRYVLYLALACLASAWFFSLEIAVLSVPSLAWFFFLRPKIHVHRQAEGREFLWTTGTRGTKNINMAAVYIASTGFKDEQGYDILGLYANQFIPKGYGFFMCLFVIALH